MRDKKKLRLKLDIAKIELPKSTTQSVISPSKELELCRVKKDFETPVSSIRFTNKTTLSNHYVLIPQEPITPGAHASVQQEQLVSPGGSSSMNLVRKYGSTPVLSEIEIYQLIFSNKESSKKSILQPIFNTALNSFEYDLHLPFMPGGNLKKQQNFIWNSLNSLKKEDIVLAWFHKQIISLLETLEHLHSAEFTDGTHKYKGVVHGDIKLDNILITDKGDLVFADLDCAYPITEPAKKFGSLPYIAPELFANENFQEKPIKDIEKSDIWSLGISLYYLIKNKAPSFEKSNPANDISISRFFSKKNHYDYPTKNNKHAFYQEGLEADLFRKNWGKHYSDYPLAKEAKNAMAQLNRHTGFLTSQRPFTLTQLYNLTLSMLLPISKRPSATQILNKIKKMSSPKPLNIFYDMFIADLLTQRSFNQDTTNNFVTRF